MSFKIFEEEYFMDVSRKKEKEAIGYINSQKEDYLLNVNEQEFIKNVYAKYSFDLINIHFEEGIVTEPKDDYNGNFHVFVISGHNDEEKEKLWYVLPFEGSKELLKCKPNSCLLLFKECNIMGNQIRFEILNLGSNYINRELDEIKKIKENMK